MVLGSITLCSVFLILVSGSKKTISSVPLNYKIETQPLARKIEAQEKAVSHIFHLSLC